MLKFLFIIFQIALVCNLLTAQNLPAQADKTKYRIQMSAIANNDTNKAKKLAKQYADATGMNAYILLIDNWLKVHIGDFPNLDDAEKSVLSVISTYPRAWAGESDNAKIIFSYVPSQNQVNNNEINEANKQTVKSNSGSIENTNSDFKNNLEITISTAKDFVNNLRSNTTLKLTIDTLYLDEVNNGNELKIKDLKNISILSTNKKSFIYTSKSNNNVITFENCENISLSNINSGHAVGDTKCSEGVWQFSDCKNIMMNHCELEGSGYEGLTMKNVSGIQFNFSQIRNCSYSIMTLDNCKDIRFDQSSFYKNEQFNLFNLSKCFNIQFNQCNIYNNKTSVSAYGEQCLFFVENSSSIVFTDCKINNNIAHFFSNKKSSIDLINTTIENNSFLKKKFKDM